MTAKRGLDASMDEDLHVIWVRVSCQAAELYA